MSDRPTCDWIKFTEFEVERRKTKIVRVVSTHNGERLGQIKWHGGWRQYAFFPLTGTAWTPECMEAIAAYLDALMAERRVGAA